MTPLILAAILGSGVLVAILVSGLFVMIRRGSLDVDTIKKSLGGDTNELIRIPAPETEDCRDRVKKECASGDAACADRTRLECLAEGGTWTYSSGQPGWQSNPVYVDRCRLNLGKYMHSWGQHTCSSIYCDNGTGLCSKLTDGSIKSVDDLHELATCDDKRILHAWQNRGGMTGGPVNPWPGC